MDVTTPRRLGATSLHLSPLGMGGAGFGDAKVTDEACDAMVRAAWRTGIRFFDTAPSYGAGRSERRLGIALEGLLPSKADGPLLVNTKVGKTLGPAAEKLGKADLHFAYDGPTLRRQHDDSLDRLGRSAVASLTLHDLDYGYHDDDRIAAHLDALGGGGGAEALHDLRREGTIAALGCGCNCQVGNVTSCDDGRHDTLMQRLSDVIDFDFLLIAGAYTLLDTRALACLLPLCARRGMSVIVGAPLAGGWLADPTGTNPYMYGQVPEAIEATSRRMARICRDHGVSLASAALQFPLAHPCVTCVIPGPRSVEEVQQNHHALTAPIPPEVWRQFKREGLLDEAAPTPNEVRRPGEGIR